MSELTSVARKFRKWIPLLVISAFSAWDAQAAHQTDSRLRLATYNLLHDFPNFNRVEERMKFLESEIRRRNIDIIGIQEAASVAKLSSRRFPGGNVPMALVKALGFDHVYRAVDGIDFKWFTGFQSGLGILSRYPVINSELFRFRTQAKLPLSFITGTEKRSVLRAVIETPYGRISVFNTHLTDRDERINLHQSDELADFVQATSKGLPTIVMGDFNSTPDSRSLRLLMGQRGYVSASDRYEPGIARETCCVCIERNYFNSQDPCPREERGEKALAAENDFLFLVPGIGPMSRVEGARPFMAKPFKRPGGGSMMGSDHLGVEAEISFGN